MHRKNLLLLLANYHPTAPQEVIAKKQIQDFVTQHPDCFERSLLIGHITASAWLINHDNSKALLMHHAKLNKWVQLGGHCDGNPNPLEVALQEAREESGLTSVEPVSEEIFDLDVHAIPEHKGVPAHTHYDIRFLLRVTKDEPLQINNESKELRWISKDPKELPTDAGSVVRMFDKWMRMSNPMTLALKKHAAILKEPIF